MCISYRHPENPETLAMTDPTQSEGDEALLQATVAGDADAVRTALVTADPNAATSDGWTALHIAAREGRAEIVRLLLSCAPTDVNPCNRWKSTPLMIAAASGNLQIVDLLLRHARTAIDLQAEYYGRTALIEAACKGHIAVVKALVAAGADLNRTDKTGRNTALVEAIKNGHVNVAVFLLRTGLIDFSNRDHRLQALIWSGSRGGDVLRHEMDTAIAAYFSRTQRIAS